ncbi:MAG: hypothetical protein FD143_932 [Ignavibacteria bacterium]|nr:MAG: hypothetical protein FD143_932 [Ignavibacteria bacterium]KAF0161175.1 MAG: hypothetical protein FD188_1086 [Ignavibacteria bacterium]
MKFRIVLLVLIISALLLACVDRVAAFFEMEYLTGTVKYVSLEGGFWAIYGDNNKNYDPLNLQKEFCSEGKRIQFTFRERNDLVSFHMLEIIMGTSKNKYL